VHRRVPVRLVRRAPVHLVRGISPAATAHRTGRQPALPRVRPAGSPRSKSPRARTARARNLPELPTVRSRPPGGDRAEPRVLRRPSRSISRGRRSSRNTSRPHLPRRNRGRPKGRRRRLSRSRCPLCRLSHGRNRSPEAKPRALPRQPSCVLHLSRPQGLHINCRPLGPYRCGIRRLLQHRSNLSGGAWGLAGRPSLLRHTRLLRLFSSNSGRPSRSRREPHPVARHRRLLRQVQSHRQDRRRVRRSSSARCLETSLGARQVRGLRWPLA
jgi:hypothetical protein